MTNDEQRDALPGLRGNLAKNENIAQLSGLLTEDGLQKLLPGKSYYAADIVFSFVVLLIFKRFCLDLQCDLTQINVYTVSLHHY